jgi:hypothetical protein
MNSENKPIVDYQTPQPPFWNKPLSSKATLWVLVGLVFFLILFFTLVPISFNASPEHAPRVKCASNLRQIGQAIQLYNADHKSYPDDPLKLLTLTDLSPEVFICPSTNHTASSQTNLTLKDHCSYIFLFQNKSANDPADVIIAYEDPKDQTQYMISELNAGYNPPRK